MQRLFCSFIKNRKERKDLSVLLKRMDAQPCCELHVGYCTNVLYIKTPLDVLS